MSKQQTAVDLLLSKIPDAAQIKAFIAENDADEKMLDEWLWERIYKGIDYKQKERHQIIDAYNCGYRDAEIVSGEPIVVDVSEFEDAIQYYKETYE